MLKKISFRLIHSKQAGTIFEFCTFIRNHIKELDHKLILVIQIFLETLIQTVISYKCNNKMIAGK